MIASNLEMELIRRATTRKGLPKGAKPNMVYFDNYLILKLASKHATTIIYDVDGKAVTANISVKGKLKVENYPINTEKDLDGLFLKHQMLELEFIRKLEGRI